LAAFNLHLEENLYTGILTARIKKEGEVPDFIWELKERVSNADIALRTPPVLVEISPAARNSKL